jgi:hypothetical protein
MNDLVPLMPNDFHGILFRPKYTSWVSHGISNAKCTSMQPATLKQTALHEKTKPESECRDGSEREPNVGLYPWVFHATRRNRVGLLCSLFRQKS